jgi:hypothetical protein
MVGGCRRMTCFIGEAFFLVGGSFMSPALLSGSPNRLALLYPKVIVAVCGMSVPYLGYSPRNEPLLSRLQQNFGTCLPELPYCASGNKQENAKFYYILHHNLPQVGEEYDRNCEEALYRLYSFKPGVDCEPPEVTDK